MSDFCLIAKPITYSDADLSCMTEETARQIELHNALYDRMCP